MLLRLLLVHLLLVRLLVRTHTERLPLLMLRRVLSHSSTTKSLRLLLLINLLLRLLLERRPKSLLLPWASRHATRSGLRAGLGSWFDDLARHGQMHVCYLDSMVRYLVGAAHFDNMVTAEPLCAIPGPEVAEGTDVIANLDLVRRSGCLIVIVHLQANFACSVRDLVDPEHRLVLDRLHTAYDGDHGQLTPIHLERSVWTTMHPTALRLLPLDRVQQHSGGHGRQGLLRRKSLLLATFTAETTTAAVAAAGTCAAISGQEAAQSGPLGGRAGTCAAKATAKASGISTTTKAAVAACVRSSPSKASAEVRGASEHREQQGKRSTLLERR